MLSFWGVSDDLLQLKLQYYCVLRNKDTKLIFYRFYDLPWYFFVYEIKKIRNKINLSYFTVKNILKIVVILKKSILLIVRLCTKKLIYTSGIAFKSHLISSLDDISSFITLFNSKEAIICHKNK